MIFEKTAASILIGIGSLQTLASVSPIRFSHPIRHASFRVEADGHVGTVWIHFGTGDLTCRLCPSGTNARFGSHYSRSNAFVTIYLGHDTSQFVL